MLSCSSTLEVLVVVVGAVAGMAGAAPASIGVGPRIIREVVDRGNFGRTHSGSDSAAWVLSVIFWAGGTDGEVVPLEDAGLDVDGSGRGVRSAGGLAKQRTGVLCPSGCRRVPGGGPK